MAIERENNFKQYKTAHDVDLMPKFGAGSEFGRELKDEARRKKYGISTKKYNPNDQPWLMKIGKEKQKTWVVDSRSPLKFDPNHAGAGRWAPGATRFIVYAPNFLSLQN